MLERISCNYTYPGSTVTQIRGMFRNIGKIEPVFNSVGAFKEINKGDTSFFVPFSSLNEVVEQLSDDYPLASSFFLDLEKVASRLDVKDSQMLELIMKISPPESTQATPSTPHIHPRLMQGLSISITFGEPTIVFDEGCQIDRYHKDPDALDFKCSVSTDPIFLPDATFCTYDPSEIPHQGPKLDSVMKLPRVMIFVTPFPKSYAEMIHPGLKSEL